MVMVTRRASMKPQPPASPESPVKNPPLTPGDREVTATDVSQSGKDHPFQEPFKHGFTRELVVRNVARSHAADVYYRKDGRKMRSKSDVRTFLKEHGEMQLTLDNFIFARVGISTPPHEVVRQARGRTRAAKVGTSNNVILSRVQIKSSDDDDWLTFHRYKVIERRLSDQLGTKLEEVNLLKPGVLENTQGQIIMDNVKVTYSLRKRQPPLNCVLTPRAGERKWKSVKEKHVDEAVCKYRNYGSLFGKTNVIRAELAVVIERLPLGDLQRRTNVPDSKANTEARSTYFTGELDIKPNTPREKKVLKLLFKGKGQRKRKPSGGDSENVSISPPRERRKASFSQPPPAKDKEMEKKLAKSHKIEGTMREYLEKSKEKRTEFSGPRTHARDDSILTETQSKDDKPSKHVEYSTTAGSDKREASKHKAAKDTREKLRTHSQPSPRDVENVAKSSSAARDLMEKSWQKHTKITEEVSRVLLAEKTAAKTSSSSAKIEKDRKEEGRTEKKVSKEIKAEKVSQKHSKTEKQSRRNRADEEFAERKPTKIDVPLREISSKKEKGTHSKTKSQDDPLLQKSGKKVAEDKLKKLLMDCGLSDSESEEENVSVAKKKKKQKRRHSPSNSGSSSPLQTLQEDAADKTKRCKRESLEDFDFKRRKGHGTKTKESSSTLLCKSLLFGSDEDGVEEYDPVATYVPKAATVPRTVSYSPSPVKKSVDVSEGGVEVAYVPMKNTENDFSSLFSPIEPSRQKNPAPEEYVPTAMSPARSVRGRYEEYVPRAITSTARRQLRVVDYVPTPKKETSCSAPTVPELEEEIKSARDVKDLEDRHIKYLFYKCIPDMEGIIKKKVRSWRNDDYHQGGKAKRMLTYKVYFSAFSNEQIDLISSLFIDEYVIRKNVSGDYLNQVLLPEFLIRVFMATNGTSHEESDRIMAATPFQLFDVPTHL